MSNIFKFPVELPSEEFFETLLSNNKVLIERIISIGQVTPLGQWYDQEKDEWVILLQGQAEISYIDGSRRQLVAGDYVFIPAHQQHRVEYTSIAPPCIWLAVHLDLNS
jgi:cupin 2 domain-containing protein